MVGIKPTYGRVSRSGLIAYGSSLDCVGPLARTVEDAALMLSAISGVLAAKSNQRKLLITCAFLRIGERALCQSGRASLPSVSDRGAGMKGGAWQAAGSIAECFSKC